MPAAVVAKALQELDALDGREPGEGYEAVAEGFLAATEAATDEAEKVREGWLYLDRLDYLAGRLADHPKYFEYLVRDLLGITPNPYPDEFER